MIANKIERTKGYERRSSYSLIYIYKHLYDQSLKSELIKYN